MMGLAFEAMTFAREAHAKQVRKYTGNPYADHLAEVAGIVATVAQDFGLNPEIMIAVAWLHDYIEDVNPGEGGAWGRCALEQRFDEVVAASVYELSDVETFGNREERKAQYAAQLREAPGWIQTIKCADVISNTASIVKHDPKFAKTYLAEKRALLAVMNKADQRLWNMALDQCCIRGES